MNRYWIICFGLFAIYTYVTWWNWKDPIFHKNDVVDDRWVQRDYSKYIKRHQSSSRVQSPRIEETHPIPKLFTSHSVSQSVVSSSDNSETIHTVNEKVGNEEKEIVKIEEREDIVNVVVKEEEKVQSGEEEKSTSVSDEQPEKPTSNLSSKHQEKPTSVSDEQPEKPTSVSDEQPEKPSSVSDEQPEKPTSNLSNDQQSENLKPTESSSTTLPLKPKRRNPLFIGEIEDDFDLNDPYFDHHGNITSFMETYVKLHNQLTSVNSKRCVIYLPMKETGLGNSLLALSSSFIYAALTKRAFLLNYPQFTKHFTFDFKVHNSTYTFSRRPATGFANWNRHYSIMQPTDKSMRSLSPRFYARQPGVIVTGFLAYLQYIIRHDNYILKLVKMGFIDPTHLDPSIPLSQDTPSRQYDVYYTSLAMEAARNFLRHVMKLQPWVQRMIDDIINPIQDKFLLGIHMRFGTSGGTIKDSHIFLQFFDIDSFIKQAEFVLQQKKLALNETRWILSTDSDHAEEEFRKKYGDLIITSSLFKRGHSKTGAKNPDGFTRAVIDLSLLGRCDYLVLTAHSTFSVMARLLSRNESESFVMPSRGYA